MLRRRRDARRDQSRRGGSRGFRRSLVGLAFLPLASRAPLYTRLIWSILRDSRTPMARKVIFGIAIGYLVAGRDLVPDDLPLVGGLDDLIVVLLAAELLLDGLPDELIDGRLAAVGLDRDAFERDMAQIRRLIPKPIRRLIRQLPGVIEAAGHTMHEARLGSRLRGWCTTEGSNA
jgi:uncharacterized membrane protein YkvA (DUF1232 family)